MGILAELRFRVRLSRNDVVGAGIYLMQDLVTFGGDDLPVLPKFNVTGIAISFSRPLY